MWSHGVTWSHAVPTLARSLTWPFDYASEDSENVATYIDGIHSVQCTVYSV